MGRVHSVRYGNSCVDDYIKGSVISGVLDRGAWFPRQKRFFQFIRSLMISIVFGKIGVGPELPISMSQRTLISEGVIRASFHGSVSWSIDVDFVQCTSCWMGFLFSDRGIENFFPTFKSIHGVLSFLFYRSNTFGILGSLNKCIRPKLNCSIGCHFFTAITFTRTQSNNNPNMACSFLRW